MVRKISSWVLYIAGDLVSRLMPYTDRYESFSIYPVYNRLMNWSEAIQGSGDGPWKDATGKEN